MSRRLIIIGAVALLFVTAGTEELEAALGIGPHGETLSDAQVQQLIIEAPRIHYPRLSRAVRSQGRGLYEMRIDVGTGKVNEVVILKSTGARILDIECMRALGHWRFKPGTIRIVRQAVTFRLSWRATMPDYGY